MTAKLVYPRQHYFSFTRDFKEVQLYTEYVGVNDINSLPFYLNSRHSTSRSYYFLGDRYEFYDSSNDNIYVYRGKQLLEIRRMTDRIRDINKRQLEKKDGKKQIELELIELTRILKKYRIPLPQQKLFRQFIKIEKHVTTFQLDGIENLFD